MRLGAIADDLTGASDLASVIRRERWTVLQTIGVPRAPLPPADAVVVSLKTRTLPTAGSFISIPHTRLPSPAGRTSRTTTCCRLTPYVVMRVGPVARVPYGRPGDASLAATVEALAARYRALLLTNHGPIVAESNLDSAWAAAEELEETARLFFPADSAA